MVALPARRRADRVRPLFGTYVEERADLPCEYGLIHRVTTYDPVRINAEPWIGLATDLGSVRSPSAVWHCLFGAPGWRPGGEGPTTAGRRQARAAMI